MNCFVSGSPETKQFIRTYGHVALDVAGCIPVVGEIFDGINGIIYSWEGNHSDALISYAAIIPLVGDAGKISKYFVKIGKATDVTLTGGRVLGSISAAKKFAADGAEYGEKVANAMWDSYKLKNAMKADGLIQAGQEAHHIIPIGVMKKNPVVQDAMDAGYDINAKDNGIGLAKFTKADGGVHANHPNYNNQINDYINAWAEKNSDYSSKDAKEMLENLQSTLRKQINSESVEGATKINDLKLDLE